MTAAEVRLRFDTECMAGDHPWKVIATDNSDPSASEVVRWCPVCGSITVDLDYDSRTRPGGVMPLKVPETVKHRKELRYV